jgi:ribulose-phosphate 3-epimerase
MSSKKIQLAPSILAADFMHLAEQIRACEREHVDFIHCDVMDGHFVPNLTFGPPIIRQLDELTPVPLDVHLMIEAPERSLESYRQAGADIITVHQETCPHLHRTLGQIRSLGAKAGVSVNPSTPVERLEPVLGSFDLLLIMTVNPGFGGQRFIETMLRKIETAQAWRAETRANFALAVDGGIDADTIPAVVRAGADHLVCGTAVFRGDIAANIRRLREAATC